MELYGIIVGWMQEGHNFDFFTDIESTGEMTHFEV